MNKKAHLETFEPSAVEDTIDKSEPRLTMIEEHHFWAQRAMDMRQGTHTTLDELVYALGWDLKELIRMENGNDECFWYWTKELYTQWYVVCMHAQYINFRHRQKHPLLRKRISL